MKIVIGDIEIAHATEWDDQKRYYLHVSVTLKSGCDQVIHHKMIQVDEVLFDAITRLVGEAEDAMEAIAGPKEMWTDDRTKHTCTCD